MDSALIFLVWFHLIVFLVPTLAATYWAVRHHWEVRDENLPYTEDELEHRSWRHELPRAA